MSATARGGAPPHSILCARNWECWHVCTLVLDVCVFITTVPIIKLFAWEGRGIVEDMCYDRRRAEDCVD